jgi:hypothetical protein
LPSASAQSNSRPQATEFNASREMIARNTSQSAIRRRIFAYQSWPPRSEESTHVCQPRTPRCPTNWSMSALFARAYETNTFRTVTPRSAICPAQYDLTPPLRVVESDGASQGLPEDPIASETDLVGAIPCSCGQHITWRCDCEAVTYGPRRPVRRGQRASPWQRRGRPTPPPAPPRPPDRHCGSGFLRVWDFVVGRSSVACVAAGVGELVG